MNNTILKKCLEELNKPEFRKDYVIGMLETLIEVESNPQPIQQPQWSLPTPSYVGSAGPYPIPDMTTSFPVVSQPNITSEEPSELANAYTRGPVKL